VRERKDRVDDAMHATRAAVEEGIVPGGRRRPVARLPSTSRGFAPRTTTRRPASRSSVRRCPILPARSRSIAGEDGSVIVGQDPREGSILLRLRLADRRIRQPDLEGPSSTRPRWVRVAIQNAGVGRGSADHHRSHGGRSAEEERRRRQCQQVAAAWAAMGGMDF